MQATRWEILQLLKRRGRATVDQLSRALNLTLMGVRLHLVVVERDGYVRRSTVREKPGRPALVYSLTPKAEELFPKCYHLLAEKLLEAVREQDSASDPRAVLEATAHRMATPFLSSLNGSALGQRVEQVGRLLEEIGAYASWETVEDGYLIHQYNCLFYQVAQRNRDVCAIDGLFLQHLLGRAVHRTECLLDGAGRCCHFMSDE